MGASGPYTWNMTWNAGFLWLQKVNGSGLAIWQRQSIDVKKTRGWCGITDNVPLLRSQFQCGFRGQWTWPARYEI